MTMYIFRNGKNLKEILRLSYHIYLFILVCIDFVENLIEHSNLK